MLGELVIYNHGDTVGYKIKKMGLAIAVASHGRDWLLKTHLGTLCVFVYSMCMLATFVYIYLRLY